MVIKIGVLELQGGYALHHNLLKKIGLNSLPVKSGDDLKQSNGLIIPGGESTTLSLLMTKYNLRESIIKFAKHNPVLGTCAGLILMSKDVDDERVDPLGLFDLSLRHVWLSAAPWESPLYLLRAKLIFSPVHKDVRSLALAVDHFERHSENILLQKKRSYDSDVMDRVCNSPNEVALALQMQQ